MKNIKFYFLLTAFIGLLSSSISATPVSASAKNDKSVFSFHFENCTVSDALMEISDKSGISIIANGTIKKQILSKSYNNKNLSRIISDLLRGENCAVIWNYNSGNLNSIDLWTFDKKGIKNSARNVASEMMKVSAQNNKTFPSDLNTDKIAKIKDLYSKNRQSINNNATTNKYTSNSRASGRKNTSVKGIIRTPDSSDVSMNRYQNISDNPSQKREENSIEPSISTPKPEESSIEPPPSLPEPEEKQRVLESPPMPPGL